ncbi:hypothetical protein [Nitrosopumilus sp. b2]|uniref:hypothetical protein n=1 Tax=Nitrosopumilus sp. b2 TaxID=2109908 RepID=UPI0015F6B93A|nr:hypothetical protein [Nitrosopumilus sp. b2]
MPILDTINAVKEIAGWIKNINQHSCGGGIYTDSDNIALKVDLVIPFTSTPAGSNYEDTFDVKKIIENGKTDAFAATPRGNGTGLVGGVVVNAMCKKDNNVNYDALLFWSTWQDGGTGFYIDMKKHGGFDHWSENQFYAICLDKPNPSSYTGVNNLDIEMPYVSLHATKTVVDPDAADQIHDFQFRFSDK